MWSIFLWNPCRRVVKGKRLLFNYFPPPSFPCLFSTLCTPCLYWVSLFQVGKYFVGKHWGIKWSRFDWSCGGTSWTKFCQHLIISPTVPRHHLIIELIFLFSLNQFAETNFVSFPPHLVLFNFSKPTFRL